MSSYVFGFQDVDKTKIAVVGGKGASLGELSKIEGIHVPDGFCISTEAFKRITEEKPLVRELLNKLSLLGLHDSDRIHELSGEVREVIEGISVPEDIAEQIIDRVSVLGEKNAYAIRSSATAEDLPTASFAGQLDTYLNITGKKAILQHISKCWASLFTERAITYRLQNDFDHRKADMAVVVQEMVFPQAAGILFTADPVTSNRKVSSIDAGVGLGEALVSGLVNADNYKVHNGSIEPERQNRDVLTDEQILQLEQIGRKIEAHFGCPQDIEWCLAGGIFYIVQSRPITTLFPIPETSDTENHVYVSVGHQQMMTDAMKPLGISFWQMTALRPMYEAGGRLFVDVATNLASAGGREMLLNVMGKHDPLMKDALMTIIERSDFSKSAPDAATPAPGKGAPAWVSQAPIESDPAIVAKLIGNDQMAIEELKKDIQSKSGSELFDLILEDIRQLKKRLSDPQSVRVIMSAMDASSWLNEKMEEWLGEKNAADKLSQSVPNNITSEMGLALLEVADAIRPYPAVVEFLQRVKEDSFLDELVELDGGLEARDAIHAYLDKYGMRCVGEIDITRTRWSEKPTTLLPMILTNVKNFRPGAGRRKLEQGRQEALEMERSLLDRLGLLPDGECKVDETRKAISLMRNFLGYREYPKYGIVSKYMIYKQALLKEAGLLADTGVVPDPEDIYYLTFDELREVVIANKADHSLIRRRKDEYRSYKKLTPPRVMTSDGEIVTGVYKRENLPFGAMVGLAVSAGVVEGRARVILNMEEADLQEGDILVTTFTDPSWTPLFVSIKGLVTEVGGLMTHGAVIAREYSLPAVVGVENATKLIKDGARIRVNGGEGYVVILPTLPEN